MRGEWTYMLGDLKGQILILEKKEREMEVVAKQSARTNINFRKNERERDLYARRSARQIVILGKKRKLNYM